MTSIPNWLRISLNLAIGILLITLISVLFRRVFKKSDKIHRRFLGKLANLIVIVVCLVNIMGIVSPELNLHSIFLKGSALVVAIVGFAAQPAISDLICGFLISVNKPFEIGDRIVPEGMEPGIVEDITLRHTVIRIYDGLRVIVPNSVLNTKTVINTSYKNDRRGIHLTYSVSYDTDVQYAMDTIRDCVVESPYTLGVETDGINEDSGPVYFLKFADSALILETTIWITRQTNSYVATTDVNNRINRAFKERGIEIPYNFINVIERENTVNDEDGVTKKKKKSTPAKRSIRTDTVSIRPGATNLRDAMEVVEEFATRQRFNDKSKRHLELMSEEVIGIIENIIVDDVKSKFWIEGTGLKYRIHLRFSAQVGSGEYKKLLSLSSSGKNEAVNTLSEKIWEKMVAGIKIADAPGSRSSDYEWSIQDNSLEKSGIGESILMALADDIKVTVTKEIVELVVIKSVES